MNAHRLAFRSFSTRSCRASAWSTNHRRSSPSTEVHENRRYPPLSSKPNRSQLAKKIVDAHPPRLGECCDGFTNPPYLPPTAKGQNGTQRRAGIGEAVLDLIDGSNTSLFVPSPIGGGKVPLAAE